MKCDKEVARIPVCICPSCWARIESRIVGLEEKLQETAARLPVEHREWFVGLFQIDPATLEEK